MFPNIDIEWEDNQTEQDFGHRFNDKMIIAPLGSIMVQCNTSQMNGPIAAERDSVQVRSV